MQNEGLQQQVSQSANVCIFPRNITRMSLRMA
jgi:hypothetical protein